MKPFKLISAKWIFDKDDNLVVKIVYITRGITRVAYACSMFSCDIEVAIS